MSIFQSAEWKTLSSKGGKARAAKQTKKQRSELARLAAKKRWAGKKKT